MAASYEITPEGQVKFPFNDGTAMVMGMGTKQGLPGPFFEIKVTDDWTIVVGFSHDLNVLLHSQDHPGSTTPRGTLAVRDAVNRNMSTIEGAIRLYAVKFHNATFPGSELYIDVGS